jgi:hypothetical protein
MLFGSIFTSSERGSWSRRAMEMAPRTVRPCGLLEKWLGDALSRRAGRHFEPGEQPVLEARIFWRVAERERQLPLEVASPHRQVAVRALGLHQRGDRLA